MGLLPAHAPGPPRPLTASSCKIQSAHTSGPPCQAAAYRVLMRQGLPVKLQSTECSCNEACLPSICIKLETLTFRGH
eukprot:scaffold38134_cov10-Tisochrysis_lutea.AAC.1